MRHALRALLPMFVLAAATSAVLGFPSPATALTYCRDHVAYGGYVIGFNTTGGVTCRKAKDVISKKVRGLSTGRYVCRRAANPGFPYSLRCSGPGRRVIWTYDSNAGE